MNDLVHQRCFNHGVREAAARCPECTRFFCRECITEHDDRVVCTACLKKLAAPRLRQRRALFGLVRFLQYAGGILIAWFFFFLIGQSLAQWSDSFHEGTLWRIPWIEQR